MKPRKEPPRKRNRRGHPSKRLWGTRPVNKATWGDTTTTRTFRGKGLDIQKWISKSGREWHIPGYQFAGPGTRLKERLAAGQRGINRLDAIARQHDIDYSRSKSLQDKWKADDKMIRSITNLPGKKTWTESMVKNIMLTKRKLKL